MLLAERDDAPVRDDEGVDIRLRGDDRLLDRLHLVLEQDCVEGEIALHLSAAARDFGEVGFPEVDTAPRTHVECAEPEVHGVGTCVDRGLKACEVPGWGKNLRTFHGQVLLLFTRSTA